MLLTGLTLPGGPGDLRTDGPLLGDPGGAVAGEAVLDLDGCLALPGMLDLHVHGGGGYDVAASAEELAGAVAFHHSRGTAATLVSLVTAPAAELLAQLGRVADAVEQGLPRGTVLGAHLEGPFLSHRRCGAQNPAHLRLPDRALFADLLSAARGHLRMITLAPELPGALELVEDVVAAGVLAAVGHTDATYEETVAAIDRGARVATHLFNGMRPVHHRDPGPVAASLDRGLVCEVINDGVHLHPAAARLVRDSGRPVLVSDAMAAAGVGDGHYTLGGQEVVVREATALLAGTGSLAGSTLTLDRAAARALQDGWTLEAVAAATSGTAADLLGVSGRYGVLAPGRPADAVVLSADGALRGTLRTGEWLPAG